MFSRKSLEARIEIVCDDEKLEWRQTERELAWYDFVVSQEQTVALQSSH